MIFRQTNIEEDELIEQKTIHKNI